MRHLRDGPVKEYVHLGLEGAITGDSIGCVFRGENKDVLKAVHEVCPSIISPTFAGIISGRKPHISKVAKARAIETCVWIDLHVDGIAVFKNSQASSVRLDLNFCQFTFCTVLTIALTFLIKKACLIPYHQTI